MYWLCELVDYRMCSIAQRSSDCLTLRGSLATSFWNFWLFERFGIQIRYSAKKVKSAEFLKLLIVWEIRNSDQIFRDECRPQRVSETFDCLRDLEFRSDIPRRRSSPQSFWNFWLFERFGIQNISSCLPNKRASATSVSISQLIIFDTSTCLNRLNECLRSIGFWVFVLGQIGVHLLIYCC